MLFLVSPAKALDYDTPIAKLGDLLGFHSPQAFMRWFRLRCDRTPGQYRRDAREATVTADG